MIALEIIFALAIVIIHLKKRDWPLTLFLAMIYSCFLFTIVRVPLSEHLSLDSEVYWAYVGRGDGQIFASLKNTEMPLFYIFYYTLIYIFKINPVISIILLRFAICLAIGMSYLILSKNFYKNEENSKKNLYIFLPTFFCLYDWNINYLLLGDELRNALALPFLILLLNSLAQEKYKWSILFCTLAFFSHKLGIVFGPLSILIFFFVKRYREKITRNQLLILLPIITLIGIKIFRKIIFMIGNPYLKVQVNHNILLGFIDGLLLKKGVLLAEAIYVALFFICFKNFEKIKSNILLMVSLVLSVIIFTASNYGIIMYDRFQEPNRFYFMLATYLPIVVGASLLNSQKRTIAFYILGFFFSNFLFKQFSRDVLSFLAVQRGNPLHDIINYAVINKSYIGSIIFILILIFISVYFERKIFAKESSLPN